MSEFFLDIFFEYVIGIIFVVLCGIIFYCHKNLYKAYVLSFTVHRLHWIRANMKVDYFVQKESELVNEKYYILNQDEPYIKEILAQFIAYMEQLSLREDIPYKRKFRKISIEEYAMCFLVSFLAKNEEDYDQSIKIKKYSTQDEMYNIYTLTDFGYAFYRIYHIAVTFCNNSDKIVKYIKSFCKVQEYLDSGMIKFFK